MEVKIGWLLLVLLIYSSIHAVSAALTEEQRVSQVVSNLKQSLGDLSVGLPTGLESVLKDQGLLITALESFNKFHHGIDSETVAAESGGDDLRYDFFTEASFSKYDTDTEGSADNDGNESTLAVDVHIDVVLLGFPEAATVHAKEEWFERLSRDEPLQARLRDSLQALPGPITLQNHFHLVKVSPGVTDVVQRRLVQLLQSAQLSLPSLPGDPTPLPVNAWEVEELLASLTAVTSSSHQDMRAQGLPPSFPVMTIFVFHTDLSAMWGALGGAGPLRPYAYHTGFTEAELALIAADSTVLSQCEAILEGLTGSTRLDLAATARGWERLERVASTDLIASLLEKGKDADEFRAKRGTAYYRDAVAETEVWAREARLLLDQQASPATPALRALAVLQASPGKFSGFASEKPSIYTELRIPLAKAILAMRQNTLQGTRDTRDTLCSASTWVSSEAFMWVDTQSVARAPQVLGAELSIQEIENRRHAGESAMSGGDVALAPRLVRSAEWQQLGGSEHDFDNVAIIAQLTNAMKRHYKALQRLLVLKAPGLASMCPVAVIEVFHQDPKENTWALEALYAQLASQRELGIITKEACVIAARQLGLLSATISSISETEASISNFQSEHVSESSESEVHVRRARRQLIHALESILTSSGVMHGMPHIRSGVLSEQAAEYLSYICAAVLSSAREVVSPPIQLHETSILPARRSARKSSSSTPSPAGKAALPEEKQSFLDLVFGPVSAHNSDAATSSARKTGAGDVLDRQPLVFPPLAFPTRISIEIYIVKLHNSYNPFPYNAYAEDGFDYRVLEKGLAQLRLQSQELAVTVHTIDAHASSKVDIGGAGESIELAIAACLRHTIYSNVYLDEAQGKEHGTPRQQQYVDAACVWSHLLQYDVEHAKADSVQHVPIFVLSMDTPVPTFASPSLSLSTAVGGGVLAVQNRQTHVDSGKACGGQRLMLKGRDPSGAILVAVAGLVSGIAPKIHNSCEEVPPIRSTNSGNTLFDAAADAADAAVYYGTSPMFESQTVSDQAFILFSESEIQAAHRSRTLRLLGSTYALMKTKILQVHQMQVRRRQLSREEADKQDNIPTAHGLARTLIRVLHGVRAHVEECTASRKGWEVAAAAANAAFFALEDWVHCDALHPELLAAALEASYVDGKGETSRGTFVPEVAYGWLAKEGVMQYLWGSLGVPLLMFATTFMVMYMDIWAKMSTAMSPYIKSGASRPVQAQPSSFSQYARQPDPPQYQQQQQQQIPPSPDAYDRMERKMFL